jgi:hypothetical protein
MGATPPLAERKGEPEMLTSHNIVEDGPRSEYADKLCAELDRMAHAQFESEEFRLLAEVPLTMERARFFSVQLILYGANRRDCWAYVQARAPYDVKQAIWHHEGDELINDSRAGTDHVTLMSREAGALGVTVEQITGAEPTPLIRASLYGFLHLALDLPWLGALTSSHFLERRNNSKLIKGGGSSFRWRDRLVNELGIDPEKLTSTNVHVEADEEHSDMIEAAILRHARDEASYNEVLNGARECAEMDRAFRGAMAHGMLAIPE